MSRESDPDVVSLSQIDFDESDEEDTTITTSLFHQNESVRHCQRARENMLEISRCTREPTKVYAKIKDLWDLYELNYNHRRGIGDALSAVGFGPIIYAILNVLRDKHFTSWKNRLLWKTTHDVMQMLVGYSCDSAELANDCAKGRILEAMVDNLKDFPDTDPKLKSDEQFMIYSSLSVINNIARRPENKAFFKKISCFSALLKYKESTDNFIKVVSLITLAHIADAREAHILTDDEDTVQAIVQWLNIAVDQDAKRPMKEGFTACHLAKAIEKLTIDGNLDLIFKCKVLGGLQRMLDKTILKEQIQATKCICSLAMHEVGRKFIIKDEQIMKSLQRMKKVESNKKLLDCVNNALWILEGGMNKTPEHSDQSGSPYVFISYHQHDKDMVRKIWKRLRQEQYEVWIDIEKLEGDLLETISTAVENSSVVILCMSENYKQNQTCKTTADYTHKREKKFIPLKMQSPDINDGWMGMMTGNKIVYDFSDNELFEENMNKFLYGLGKHIQKDGKKSQAQPDEPKPSVQHRQTCVEELTIREPSVPIQTTPSPLSKEPLSLPSAGPPPCSAQEEIQSMTIQDVFEFLEKNDLESCQESFKKVNGKMLWQLIEMKKNKETANYYMAMLTNDYQLNLTEILKLSAAIEDILKNQ